jgi:hypothetical protein
MGGLELCETGVVDPGIRAYVWRHCTEVGVEP